MTREGTSSSYCKWSSNAAAIKTRQEEKKSKLTATTLATPELSSVLDSDAVIQMVEMSRMTPVCHSGPRHFAVMIQSCNDTQPPLDSYSGPDTIASLCQRRDKELLASLI